MSVFWAFPNNETNACNIRLCTGIVFVTVNPDDLLVVCQHLVWCESIFIDWNSRNLVPILVLEVNVFHPLSILCTSDLFDLGVQHNCLETICILVFCQENRGSRSIWINNLNSTNIRCTSRTWFPIELNGFNRFFLGHSKEICISRVPEVDWLGCLLDQSEVNRA